MKIHSVRIRVAFWYSLSLLLICSLVTLFIIRMADRLVVEETREAVTYITEHAMSDIWYQNGKLQIDDGIIFNMDEANIAVCREDGTVLAGHFSGSLPAKASFLEEGLRRISGGGESFYLYDRRVGGEGNDTVWVRGMAQASLKNISPAVYSLSKIYWIVLPILLVISIIGGLFLMKRTFLPLRQIADTLEEIQEKKDLSRRIHYHPTGRWNKGDEFARIAGIFDNLLEQSRQSLEREQRFTDAVSHELRTPVAVIMSQGEYAARHTQEPAITGHALEVIRSQAGKMNQLITQLLFLARADKNALQLSLRRMDVSLAAEEAAAMVSPSAAERQIAVRVEAREGIYMNGDETLIGQMFSNLLSNSIRYGRDGGWVRLKVDLFENSIEIIISDNGIGMPEEELPHIWDRFYRIGDQNRPGSYGLGLPITKWIIDAHHGSVQVQSTLGMGTTFHIRLPAGTPQQL